MRTIIRIEGAVRSHRQGRHAGELGIIRPPLAQSQPGPAERHHSPQRFSLVGGDARRGPMASWASWCGWRRYLTTYVHWYHSPTTP
jgi:hypothetical protein